MERKVVVSFDSVEFLRHAIEPYFQSKFGEIINQKKNEETKASLERNIVERCLGIHAYFCKNVGFVKQTGNVDCSSIIIDILSQNFIIDTKSLNKRDPNASGDKKNEESLLNFKELSAQLLSKICVYKYQIMLRFSMLYFHFEGPSDKRELSEESKLEKEVTKDLIKLLNLFNVKLFSEDDESNPDTFYNELAQAFTKDIKNMNFLECILKILEECQVSKSITAIFESKIKAVSAANTIAATAAEVVAKSEKLVQSVPTSQQGEQKLIQINLNKKPKDIINMASKETSNSTAVGLNNFLSQNKAQDMSVLPSPKLASLKSVPTTKKERQSMAATTTYKETKFGSLWSIKEGASQSSSQKELFNSQFNKMKENSKTSEDFMGISLVEKNKELNERMRHRSFYSSFNKTTQIISKKRKNRESEMPKDLENQLKRTKLTMDTKLPSSQPVHNKISGQPVNNKISSQGIKLFEKLKQKETSVVLEVKTIEKVEKKEDNSHLKVPLINPIFEEWGFGDVLAVNTPIKEALSAEDSMNIGSCSNSRRLLEYH